MRADVLNIHRLAPRHPPIVPGEALLPSSAAFNMRRSAAGGHRWPVTQIPERIVLTTAHAGGGVTPGVIRPFVLSCLEANQTTLRNGSTMSPSVSFKTVVLFSLPCVKKRIYNCIWLCYGEGSSVAFKRHKGADTDREDINLLSNYPFSSHGVQLLLNAAIAVPTSFGCCI